MWGHGCGLPADKLRRFLRSGAPCGPPPPLIWWKPDPVETRTKAGLYIRFLDPSKVCTPQTVQLQSTSRIWLDTQTISVAPRHRLTRKPLEDARPYFLPCPEASGRHRRRAAVVATSPPAATRRETPPESRRSPRLQQKEVDEQTEERKASGKAPAAAAPKKKEKSELGWTHWNYVERYVRYWRLPYAARRVS